jgi:acid phosphatase (class A)
MNPVMSLLRIVLLTFFTIFPFGAFASACPSTDLAVIGELQPGVLRGYLGASLDFDSAKLLPAPPAEGTPLDRADRAESRALRDAASDMRIAQAARDADITEAGVLAAFAEPLGFVPSAESTPHLVILMRRVMTDAGMATVSAKQAHQRTRPFLVHGVPSCTPQEDVSMSRSGSFPSAHAAMGWAWALVLVEVVPQRTQDLLARGLTIGDSRVVCGAHWGTDVDAGRLIGAAVVARLQADGTFRRQLALARDEASTMLDPSSRPAARKACDGTR